MKGLVVFGLQKFLHEGFLPGGSNDSKPVEGFLRRNLDPSAYYDMDGVVNGQWGWGIWMSVANMDGGWMIWHIFFEMVGGTIPFTNYEIVQPSEPWKLNNELFFTSQKTEQPLQDMKLQENKGKKEMNIGNLNQKSPKIKGVCYLQT